MGGKKRAKKFFQKHSNNAWKMLGKKSSEKSARNVFLYSHEYRDQKKAGIKRAKQFFQKHKNSASKKFWEKNRRKKMPKSFINIQSNIVTKK